MKPRSASGSPSTAGTRAGRAAGGRRARLPTGKETRPAVGADSSAQPDASTAQALRGAANRARTHSARATVPPACSGAEIGPCCSSTW